MVKPGGTGRPALVISARPDPFPPSRSFMVRLPSALPFPKKYTCFFDAGLAFGLELFTLAFVLTRGFVFNIARRLRHTAGDSGNWVIDYSGIGSLPPEGTFYAQRGVRRRVRRCRRCCRAPD